MSDDTSEMGHFERIEYYRGLIPDTFRDDFQELLSRNIAPRYAASGIIYLAGQLGDAEVRSQSEIAEHFDVSAPTVRKIATIVWSDIRGNEGPYPTKESLSGSGFENHRRVTHCLYHADTQKLETGKIADVMSVGYSTVSKCLQDLLAENVVGREPVPTRGNAARWWFVPRQDTPEFSENYGSEASKTELLRDIGELYDLKIKDGRTADGDISVYSTGGGIAKSGFEKLTGTTDILRQLEILRDEYDLELGVDIHVNFTTNKTGAKKIRDEIARREGVPDDE